MDMAELGRIAQHGLGGEFRHNEPMRKHVSWRAGGTADRAYFPRDLEDLARFVRAIPRDEPVYFVGLGSNLLVRDGGLRGTVVFTHPALSVLRIETDAAGTPLVYAECGVASPKVARFAANHDLRRAEFLAGIPGTVGGALAMNAGCFGSETWTIVDSVLRLTRGGELIRRTPADFDIAYRHVELRAARGGQTALKSDTSDVPSSLLAPHAEEWFAAATFRLVSGDGREARRVIRDLLQRRIDTQPLNQPNAGSVFRNPSGEYAARLIESCAMKGLSIGGAMVSPKHANFIVNTGNATAADIERLIERVRQTVWDRCGVQLETEVRIVGERT